MRSQPGGNRKGSCHGFVNSSLFKPPAPEATGHHDKRAAAWNVWLLDTTRCDSLRKNIGAHLHAEKRPDAPSDSRSAAAANAAEAILGGQFEGLLIQPATRGPGVRRRLIRLPNRQRLSGMVTGTYRKIRTRALDLGFA